LASPDATINIQLNGAPREITPGTTLEDLVSQLDLAAGRFAVEVNQQIVSKSLLPQHKLQTGDCVEIVGFVGGG